MNTPVSFELAKLLKEKGIIFQTKEYYSSDTKVTSVSYNEFAAPTIADVVMWLYEKHEIWISVEPPFPRRIVLWEYYIQKANHRTSLGQNSGYNTPIEAYEAAIKYTLENHIK